MVCRFACVVVCALAAMCACSKPTHPTAQANASASENVVMTSVIPAPSSSVDAVPSPTASATCGGGQRLVVHFYDVGQALAALVDLPDGRHVLVDTGDSPKRPGCGAACASANAHLLSKLQGDLHGAPIDLLWVTHQHSDHIGGAAEVLHTFKVGTYTDNGRDDRKAEVRRAHEAAIADGTVIRIVDPEHTITPLPGSPNVSTTAIVPSAWPSACSHDPNECTIGLRIDYCASSVLFTGDAEHDEEAQLDLHGPVTLLQVAHHGSATSTTPGFLIRAKPRYAVISAGKEGQGKNSDYCHPRAIIVRRLSRVLGGPEAKTLKAFDGERCDRAVPTDWIDVPTSDRLWATERDGDVVLTTTGDGTFVRE